MNRRELIKTTGIATAATVLPISLMHAQTPATTPAGMAAGGAKIAGTREDFDAEFGTGTDTNGVVMYGDGSEGTATYAVIFNEEGLAENIVIDFAALEGGGLPATDELGQSRFIWEDAEPGVLTTMGSFRADEAQYAVLNWNSPELAAATGRSGNTIVMDRTAYAGIDGGTIIQSTSISMETFEVNPIVPTGESLGVHNTMEEWTEFARNYRDGSSYQETQFGLLFTDEIGNYVITENGVSVEIAKPLTSPEAAQMASDMLPAGAEIAFTTLTPYEDGVRVHGLMFEGQSIVVGQWVAGGEETGQPTKLMFGSALLE